MKLKVISSYLPISVLEYNTPNSEEVTVKPLIKGKKKKNKTSDFYIDLQFPGFDKGIQVSHVNQKINHKASTTSFTNSLYEDD